MNMHRKLVNVATVATIVFIMGAQSLFALAVPKPVTASYTDCVRVSWCASSGATHYQLWRATSSSFSCAVRIGTFTCTAVRDTTAIPGVNYYYWVRPYNSRWICHDNSKYTLGRRQVTVPWPTASWKNYTSCVKVTWPASPYACYYKVYRSSGQNFCSSTYLGKTSGRVWNDATAIPGAKYWYWVCPVGRNGVGYYNNAKRDYGMRAVIMPPVYVTRYYDHVRLSWPSVYGANYYRVFYRLNNRNVDLYNGRNFITTTGTAWNDWDIYPGEAWYYWVVPVSSRRDGTGTCDWWGSASRYVIGRLAY